MAVYAGARPRSALLPQRRRARSAPRRKVASQVRAHRRSSPVTISLAAIVVCFLLGLVYLSQTVHVAATTYDLDALAAEREHLQQTLRRLETDIYRWGAEPAVLQQAQELGLSGLGRPVRVPAR
jgi:hypothetical protein